MTTDAKNKAIQVGDVVVLRGTVVAVEGDDVVVSRAFPRGGAIDTKNPGDAHEASLIRLVACEVEVDVRDV